MKNLLSNRFALVGSLVLGSFFLNSSSMVKEGIEDSSCTFDGIELYGKVKFVTSFPDIKIQYVSSFPDIKVKFVSSFADDCGEWEEVDSFPDFTVQIVDSFPDLKVQVVDSFPGMQ